MRPIEVEGIELEDADNQLGVGAGARIFFKVFVLETDDGGEIDCFEIEEIWPAVGVECLERPVTVGVMSAAARMVSDHVDESADYYVKKAIDPYEGWGEE